MLIGERSQLGVVAKVPPAFPYPIPPACLELCQAPSMVSPPTPPPALGAMQGSSHCPMLTVFVLEHSGGALPPAPSTQWQPSSSLHLKMPFQVSMLGQMPEDTPGYLFFPTEVSAVGSVPMCQGT